MVALLRGDDAGEPANPNPNPNLNPNPNPDPNPDPNQARLIASFKDETRLYMVLEFLPGGELFSLLAKHNRLSEEGLGLLTPNPRPGPSPNP